MSVIKLQAPFERLISSCGCSEISLKRAVILQAMIDASNVSKNKTSVKIEQEAKNWLKETNENFRCTCEDADLNPAFVLKIAQKMMDAQVNKVFNI